MKIKIQTESGALKRNWYIQDLDCYTPEFLQQIILSLVYSPQDIKQSLDNSNNSIVIDSSKGVCKETKPSRDTPEDTIQSKHKAEIDKDYDK